MRYAQWHNCHLAGWYFSVQPVLLISQGAPSLFHSLEAAKRRLIDCNLGKVRTTISVLKEGVGLFHCVSSYALKPFNPQLIGKVPICVTVQLLRR